jgi:hypothetical protein
MAAIFADAAVFGFKALSKECSPSSHDDKSVPAAAETWNNMRAQV